MSSVAEKPRFSPDSVYAEYSVAEREIFDRQERESNMQRSGQLALKDEAEGHSVHGLPDDSLRRLAKTYRRQIEDIEDGDLGDSKTGYRKRMLTAQIADIEAEQDYRSALAESWQAAQRGTHSFTGYAARGGLAAVVDHGATPPSYDLAQKLDWRNWKQGLPHVLEWSEAA